MSSFFTHALGWCLRHPLGHSQWCALGLWLAGLVAALIMLGDHIVLTANRDVQANDQAAYLALTEANRGALWPAATDGIRNPLFSWLLAQTARGDREAMFEAGKHLNIRLGAFLAILLGVWAGSRLAWLPAMTLVTLGGFGVFLPLSTFVGAELLFYGLFFAAWVLALGLLDKLSLPRCALLGAVLGLAYLAKPGVTLFSGCFVVVGLARWWWKAETAGWQGARPLLGAALALALAVPMVLPRALHAWRVFGDPLQNTAEKCFWAENWDDCLTKLKYFNPRSIEKLSPDERPSFSRYCARHGWSDAWQRFAEGMREQCHHIFLPDHKSLWFARHHRPSPEDPVRRIFPCRGFFLLPPLVLLLSLGVIARCRFGVNAIPASAWFQAAFVALLLGASFGAFSWYVAIASGARFIMAFYLPVLAVLLCAVEALRRKLVMRWCDALCGGTWLLLLGLFVAHAAIICTHPFFKNIRSTL